MKVLICCVFLVVAVGARMTPEQIAKIEPISKECAKKTGVDQEQIRKIREDRIIEGDPKLHAHVLCVAVKTGMVSDSGDIHWDTIETKLEKLHTSEETIAEIKTCAKKRDTPEETAVKLMKCLFEKQPNFHPVD